MSNSEENAELGLSDDDAVKSIEDIIAEEEKDKAAESARLRKATRPAKVKKAALIGGSTLVLAGLVVGGIMLNPFQKTEQTVGKKNQEMSQAQDASSIAENKPKEALPNDAKPFYLEDGKYYPVPVQDWELKPFSDQDQNAVNAGLDEMLQSTDLGASASSLPSEAAGFTADPSKADLPDGTLNPMYSYWTAESFNRQANSYIQRLLNPSFGNWAISQYASSPANAHFDMSQISDMFTSRWIGANAQRPFSDYVPVYADWAANDYGMGDKLLQTGPRWVGQVQSSTSDFVYDTESQQYTVNFTANVKFSAWGQDQSRLEKNGVLTLKFVSNATGSGDAKHTVLIDDASLKVD